jgi:hypothetical protein
LTASSTLLVLDARWFRSLTLSDVPAGIVTSRNVGVGGGGGAADAGAAAAGAATAGAAVGVDAGAAAGVAACAGAADGDAAGAAPAPSDAAGLAVSGAAWPAAPDCAGCGWEHAMTQIESVTTEMDLIMVCLRRGIRRIRRFLPKTRLDRTQGAVPMLPRRRAIV